MRWVKKVATTPLSTVAKVIDSLQAQANERINAPSIHAVREYIDDHIADLYPVGSIYLSVNPGNPTNMFGGTWVQIKDRFLLAAGDTYTAGNTGGEATHKLTANEIPRHNHVYTYPEPYGQSDPGNQAKVVVNSVQDTSMVYSNDNTGYVGGDQAHNNMPPYLVVYVWRRTA